MASIFQSVLRLLCREANANQLALKIETTPEFAIQEPDRLNRSRGLYGMISHLFAILVSSRPIFIETSDVSKMITYARSAVCSAGEVARLSEQQLHLLHRHVSTITLQDHTLLNMINMGIAVGDSALIQKLFNQGVMRYLNIRSKNPSQSYLMMNPLYRAVMTLQVEIVQYLLTRKDISIKDQGDIKDSLIIDIIHRAQNRFIHIDGTSLRDPSSQELKAKMIQLVLKHLPIDPNEKGKLTKSTPLYEALRPDKGLREDLHIARALLEDARVDPNQIGAEDEPPLCLVAYKIEWGREERREEDLFKIYGCRGEELLEKIRVARMRLLMSHPRINFNIQGYQGKTPLRIVIDEICESLSRIEDQDKERALDVFKRYREGLTLLLQREVDPSIADDEQNTPLHIAARQDFTGILCAVLLKEPHPLQEEYVPDYHLYKHKRSDPHVLNHQGYPPLLEAAKGKNREALAVLEPVTDAHLFTEGDDQGNTALHRAVINGDIEVVKYLLLASSYS
jgi:hypothetical protein